MLELRPFDHLGHFQKGWLNARHHFSFGEYYNPERMGWGAVRVWNDDEIAPQSGFAPHPHRDMEIITYVRHGAITHQDNLGNEGRTEAGDVQVMSAGTGVVHAEYNREDEATTLFQIWIEPSQKGGAPRWDAARFPKSDRAGSFVTLASGRPGDDALEIRADARVLGATLTAGQAASYTLEPGRRAYLVAAAGTVTVSTPDGQAVELKPRDAAAAVEVTGLTVTAHDDAEVVLTDTL